MSLSSGAKDKKDRKHKQAEQPLVQVGRILAPVGIRGQVSVQVLSDVSHRFADGAILLYADGSPLTVQRSFSTPKGLTVKFTGVDNPNAADALRDKALFVYEVDVPQSPQDTYYHYQVLGMRVVSEEGEELGVVTEIISTGANDVYVITGEDREILVPALADVVVSVDVNGKLMTVNLPEGL